jgi:hypothetical protein
VLTPEEKAAEIQSLRMKFFIFTQLGGLMILMSSISPFFAANQIPGIIILTASMIYDNWKSASKLQKRLLVYSSLLSALFIGLNALNKWFVPAELVDKTSKLFPTFITSEMTLTFGYIGHMIVLIGIFQALSEIRIK